MRDNTANRRARSAPKGSCDREAFAAAEAGKIPQREFEVTVGRLLGVSDQGLLARALGGLRPRPEVLDLIKRTRAAGVRAGMRARRRHRGQPAARGEALGMATVHFIDSSRASGRSAGCSASAS